MRSRTSSFAFKGKASNAAEAGKQLGAEYIVEGSVLRAGEELRVNARWFGSVTISRCGRVDSIAN